MSTVAAELKLKATEWLHRQANNRCAHRQHVELQPLDLRKVNGCGARLSLTLRTIPLNFSINDCLQFLSVSLSVRASLMCTL